MSNINGSNDPNLSAVLAKLGVPTQTSGQNKVPPAPKQTLGQDDFLRLMTTQIKSQDPFKPLDNAEFISQMAQFSTVTGISDIKNAVDNLGTSLGANRIATFSNLLGSKVLAPGGTAVLDDSGVIEGAVDLDAPADNVRIAVNNAMGQTVDVLDLGPGGPGLMGFSWSVIDAGIGATVGDKFTVSAMVTNGKSSTAAEPELYQPVEGVDMRGTNERLSLRSGKTIGLDQINSIRK